MGGMVIPSHPRRGFLAPWQSALLSLAGPGIDLLVFIVVVWLLASPPDVWRDLPAGGQLELILGVTAGYLVYSHLREFWPRKVQTHRGETYNDMGAVWELAKLKWKNPGLQALIRTLKDCIESRDTTALRRVHSAYEAAIQSCRDPAARDYLNDCLCTTVLLHDLPGLLDLADRASSDLFRAQPDQLTYRGTRGGVLAERGDAQCVALLEHVVDQSSAVHDRSISAAFLSIFYLRSHQLDLARDWLEKARSFNPECLAVQRAAAEMSQAKGDQSS